MGTTVEKTTSVYNLNTHTHVEGGRRGGWGLARGENAIWKLPTVIKREKKLQQFIAYAHPFIFQTLSSADKYRLEVLSCHLHSRTEDNQHQVNISEDIHLQDIMSSLRWICVVTLALLCCLTAQPIPLNKEELKFIRETISTFSTKVKEVKCVSFTNHQTTPHGLFNWCITNFLTFVFFSQQDAGPTYYAPVDVKVSTRTTPSLLDFWASNTFVCER